MFSRFDESTHSLISAHLIRPDGTGEVELTLPFPEPPFSFSRDGTRIAVATSLEDGRIATAILRLDGTIERVLEIPDPTSDFDGLVDRYGVEKIKTIGDAYMVAAGVPRRRNDHAQVLAAIALEMCEIAARYARVDGGTLGLRIGINSGPVVAGVIGRRKFIYDLWGDAVNTASRMESHGTPGQIQIGERTYELVKDDFVCEPRGLIEVKGKGPMPTWYLVGARA